MYTKIRPHTLHGVKQQTKGGTLFGVLLGLGLATILAGVAVWFLYTAPTPFIDKQVTAAKTGTAAQQQAQIQSAMQGMQGMAAGTPVPVALAAAPRLTRQTRRYATGKTFPVL